MKFAVIDTETTGLGEKDQVVEVAVAIGNWYPNRKQLTLNSTFSSLVRPTVPVQPEARAAHHIADEELAGVPSSKGIQKLLPSLSGSVVVGHNLPFDLRMLEQSGLGDWVRGLVTMDTYHMSKHVWPEAPSHKNQVLRYWLELATPSPHDQEASAMLPHRALPDALVTFAMLERMLQAHGYEALQSMMTTQPLLTVCRIGKEWSGKPWSAVDVGMLKWILGRDFGPDVKHTARHWLMKKTGRAA